MSFLSRLLVTGLSSLCFSVALAAPPTVELYKSPSCGCCGHYVTYLKNNGFNVAVRDTEDMQPVKQRYGVGTLGSCHTARVAGYTVEGHVPAASLHKLLKQRPKIVGIALPGMPPSSPGMGPAQKGSLTVRTLEKNGQARVFDVQ